MAAVLSCGLGGAEPCERRRALGYRDLRETGRGFGSLVRRGRAAASRPSSHHARRHSPWRHPRHHTGLHADRPGDPAARDRLERAVNEADRLRPRRSRGAAGGAGSLRAADRAPRILRQDARPAHASRSRTRSSSGASCCSPGRPGCRGRSRPVRVNGFSVDFHWPDLGLVVETDGLRYHRTPGTAGPRPPARPAHAAAGLTTSLHARPGRRRARARLARRWPPWPQRLAVILPGCQLAANGRRPATRSTSPTTTRSGAFPPTTSATCTRC